MMQILLSMGKAVKTIQFAYGLLKTSDSAFFALSHFQRFPRLARYLRPNFRI